MNYQFRNIIIITLGGSVAFPDGVDYKFLKKFRACLAPFLREGKKFVLVVGGGKIAREYQRAAARVVRVADEDKDWIGIHATRLNAHLVRTIFRDVADPVVIDSRKRIARLRYPITVASGWKPGWSTDYIAIALAEDFKVQEVVVAGKPSHVYNKNVAKHKNAKPFSELNWTRYQKLIPTKWAPGIHAPVDPVAARLAEKKEIAAIIIGGKDLKNFTALLRGQKFQGTVIR